MDVEKTKGITVHSIKHQVSYKNQKFCLIDSPGHIDFVPNMINSALKSNIGLLVVDSTVGAFEKGFGGGGQTKEHLLVLKTFAITSLVVVLNKFDVLKESPMERYEEIKSKLSKYAKSIGFKLLNFVPCSALTGWNVLKEEKAENSSDDSEWFNGPSVMDAIINQEMSSLSNVNSNFKLR